MRINQQFDIYATIEKINAIPWGKVFIDGHYKGVTPLLEIKVSEGLHTIKIENPKYKPFFHNINVAGGEKIANIHAKLEKK